METFWRTSEEALQQLKEQSAVKVVQAETIYTWCGGCCSFHRNTPIVSAQPFALEGGEVRRDRRRRRRGQRGERGYRGGGHKGKSAKRSGEEAMKKRLKRRPKRRERTKKRMGQIKEQVSGTRRGRQRKTETGLKGKSFCALIHFTDACFMQIYKETHKDTHMRVLSVSSCLCLHQLSLLGRHKQTRTQTHTQSWFHPLRKGSALLSELTVQKTCRIIKLNNACRAWLFWGLSAPVCISAGRNSWICIKYWKREKKGCWFSLTYNGAFKSALFSG